MNRVLAIAGPTGAGKTAAAIAVAEAFGGVVVSADAMQVFRGMDIGTNKVTREEQARVPHFGLDQVDPDGAFDAADFVELADGVIARSSCTILCGGTSLYLRSFTRGLVQTPAVDPTIRADLEALPDPHAELARVDPGLAARLHPHDTLRIVRGLEVFRATGRRLSELQAVHGQQPDRVPTVGLWLDRPDLDERLDARVLAMIDQGYVDEVRGLLDRGYARTLKSMSSLGYRHLCDHLLDALPLDEAIRRTQRDTRRFARKQRTWMRGLGYAPTATVDEVLTVAAGLYKHG